MALRELRQLHRTDARQDVQPDVLSILPERGALSRVGLDLLDPLLGHVSNGEVAVERHMRASADRDLRLLFVSYGFSLALEPLLMPFSAAVGVVRDPPECFDLLAFRCGRS